MVALGENNQVIGSQLQLYDQLGRSDATVDPVEIGAIVGFGLHLYHTLRRLDEQWSQATQRNSIPPALADAERLGRLYRRWLHASQSVLAMVGKEQADGQQILDFGEFRDACNEVLSMLNIPLAQLYAPVTGVKPSAEVRDALQRRLQQRS